MHQVCTRLHQPCVKNAQNTRKRKVLVPHAVKRPTRPNPGRFVGREPTPFLSVNSEHFRCKRGANLMQTLGAFRKMGRCSGLTLT